MMEQCEQRRWDMNHLLHEARQRHEKAVRTCEQLLEDHHVNDIPYTQDKISLYFDTQHVIEATQEMIEYLEGELDGEDD